MLLVDEARKKRLIEKIKIGDEMSEPTWKRQCFKSKGEYLRNIDKIDSFKW